MTKLITELTNKRCRPCKSGDPALPKTQARALLKHLPEWKINKAGTDITRTYDFKNYYHTLAFVNAVAWIAHQQDHHPTLTVHYNHCDVRYTTDSIKGLSENDFICAAKIDALVTAKN